MADALATRDLEGLPAAAFALFLAEYPRSLVARWPAPSTVGFVTDAIDRCWASLVAATGFADLSAAIGALPESDCDDSERRDYYVMRALGLVYYATGAVYVAAGGGGDHRLAELVSSADEESSELAEMVTAIARRGGPFATDLDGLLSECKRRVHLRLSEVDGAVPPAVVAEVRAQAETFSAALGAALPLLATVQPS